MAIRFKEKQFNPAALGALALNGAMIGVPAVLQMNGNATSEEQGQEQLDEMKRHNAMMEKAAQTNPQGAIGAERTFAIGSIMGTMAVGGIVDSSIGSAGQKAQEDLQERMQIEQNRHNKAMAKSFSIMSGLKGLGKDVWNLAKSDQGIHWGTGLVASGVGIGIAGYGANKVIQGLESRNENKQKTYSIMSGKLGVVKDSFMKHAFNSGTLLIGGTMAALPYITSKMGEKSAVNNTAPATQQTNYSLSWKAIKDTTTSLGGGLLSMGAASKEGIAKFGKRLSSEATSDYGRRLGGWIERNPNAATWAGAATLMPVGAAAYDVGQGMVEKPLRAIDKKAYAWEDKQNQMIQ